MLTKTTLGNMDDLRNGMEREVGGGSRKGMERRRGSGKDDDEDLEKWICERWRLTDRGDRICGGNNMRPTQTYDPKRMGI